MSDGSDPDEGKKPNFLHRFFTKIFRKKDKDKG